MKFAAWTVVILTVGAAFYLAKGVTPKKPRPTASVEKMSATPKQKSKAQKALAPTAKRATPVTREPNLKATDDISSPALEQAKALDEEWDKKREVFLATELKLTDLEITQVTHLRTETEKKEAQLLESVTNSEEEESQLRQQMRKNRAQYDTRFEAVIGKEKWNTFLAFYKDYWNLSENSPAHSIHTTLR